MIVAQTYRLPCEPVNHVFALPWSIGTSVATYARVKFVSGHVLHGEIDEFADDDNDDTKTDK